MWRQILSMRKIMRFEEKDIYEAHAATSFDLLYIEKVLRLMGIR